MEHFSIIKLFLNSIQTTTPHAIHYLYFPSELADQNMKLSIPEVVSQHSCQLSGVYPDNNCGQWPSFTQPLVSVMPYIPAAITYVCRLLKAIHSLDPRLMSQLENRCCGTAAIIDSCVYAFLVEIHHHHHHHFSRLVKAWACTAKQAKYQSLFQCLGL